MEVLNIFIAILLGALIGLQREYAQQKEKQELFAGIRTFILIALFGSILGQLSQNFNSIWVILGFIFTILFSILAYFLIYKKLKDIDGTTEVAFVLTYLIGVMATTGYLKLSVVLGILITTFLTFKEKLHGVAKKLEKQELVAMVKFALIAFVILPFLPNINYSPLDIPGLGQILNSLGIANTFLAQLNILNPYLIWLMVIFITGINLLGYFLVKFFGSKGYGLTGLVGGLVSSTAVTLSMSAESKKSKLIKPFLVATIVATAVMFIRVIFEVAVLNFNLLQILIFPLGGMALFSFILVFIIQNYKKKINKIPKKVELKQPFALLPALKFGGIFALVLLISKIAQILFGKTGIYTTSLISGLADVDAITLTMSNLANSGTITGTTASIAITLAVISNTFVKAGIAYFLGNKKFSQTVFFSFLLILLIGLVILFL